MTEQDNMQIEALGICEEQVNAQLQRFAEGFPFLPIKATATIGKGISALSDAECEAYVKMWDIYCEGAHKVTKFVPASGAASRMFKDLFAFIDADYEQPTTPFEQRFVENLPQAPFRDDLDVVCDKLFGKNVAVLLAEGRSKDAVRALLYPEGLNYGLLPKGLLKFHRYADGVRTPIEEHLVEGALYAQGADKVVRLHFTISPEHRTLFESVMTAVVPIYEKRFGVSYEIELSEQKSATNTIAVTPDNAPFRNDDGTLLFRPAGHGALLHNLDGIDSDIVFIKTIDNVSPEHRSGDTLRYKKTLAGVLVAAQAQLFNDLSLLEEDLTMEQLREMLARFQTLFCSFDESTNAMDKEALASYLRRKLDRPIRVCGMVRNVGEPGGGPFLAVNPDGSVSPQILESSQIDMADAEKRRMFEEGTHFNPVDLVCGLKNRKGEKFDLTQFVDANTGFISEKSKGGRPLKALELPGLWNGSMSDWNTIFVEVPLSTFNPVKTVNDLFREQHQ